MAIATLDDFKRYCLRALGEPVVTIDVTDEQLQDRYDDALHMYQDHHFDGVERTYIVYEITLQDTANRYIPIPSHITGVNRVLPFQSTGFGAGLFSAQYQFLQNDMNMLWNGGAIAYYEQTFQQIAMLDQLLNGKPQMRFNRVQDRLFIDTDWTKKLQVGDTIVIECYAALNPEEFIKIFESSWFKRYMISLVKKQWGTNIKKFGNVSLIGGASINGQQIFNEAVQEIAELEQELYDKWSEPPDAFYIG